VGLVVAGFVFILAFCFIMLWYLATYGKDAVIRTRLSGIKDTQTEDWNNPLSLPFRVRVIKPFEDKVILFVSSLLPVNVKASIDRKLSQAGNPRGMKSGAFIAVTSLSTLSLTVIALLIGLWIGAGVLRTIAYSLGLGVLVVLIFVVWLYTSASGSVKRIERALPDAIDLLVVSVEAGLGFDQAISKITERMKGPLAEEFAKALQDMKLGKQRHVALRDLARRTGSQTLSTFVAMIVQATQMGVSIGRVLRIQSDSQRRERRQRAEELAMQAPIKMLFPLVFCIFPALFVVILGPGVIQIYETLMKR
jgi:tight adherence protein C